MNINATLIGQMITFGLFVLITMKYIWPPLMSALEERQGKIADGLAAAERGQRELELAQHKSTDVLREAKIQASEIIEKANHRASQIVEAAKDKAREEGKRLYNIAQEDIASEVNQAKQVLRKQVATIAISGAERILKHNIDQAVNSSLINDLIEEL